MTLLYMILRNIKMFIKDKGYVISSMITPLILIVLYVTFLKNVYVDSFNSALEINNITLDIKYVNGFVYGWLFSSLLSVSSVTVSFCSNLLMVQDKITGSIKDIEISPVKKTKIALSYYLASMTITMIIILLEAIVGLIILSYRGFFLSFSDILGILLSTFLLVNFGTSLSSIIHYFLKTQGQMSAVGTLVSSIYGFICGAYMPINQFGLVLQRILSFLPGTYGTTLIRYYYERGVLHELTNKCNFPQEVVDNMAKNFDISMSFFSHEVTHYTCLLIMFIATFILMLIYILMNYKKSKN